MFDLQEKKKTKHKTLSLMLNLEVDKVCPYKQDETLIFFYLTAKFGSASQLAHLRA